MAIVIALIGAAILVGLIFMQSNKLADPENKTAVYLDELPGLVALQGGGLYVLNLYRQSGNPYADGKVFDTPADAVAAAMSTFRRAQIDSVAIQINTVDKLDVSRAFFSHRGRAEGKKVGAFEIIRVDDQ
ncbi:hypothetical protein [Brevundimonas sp.]|uniref:hypothetical protein n=1 Tax=Brevundimonas sp. TaxID=1871086 RepID=UPI0028A14B80|nr:hypothetical protein [Brevundimonas sp.]